MSFRTIIATAAIAGFALTLAMPVDAATKKRTRTTVIYYNTIEPNWAPRTRRARLVVQPRSYLSAGTETKQHEEHYTDYAYPPGGSWDYQNRNSAYGSFNRQPLADPWDIPGYPKF